MTQWRTREDEIAQWASYMDDLTAWAAQASLDFSVEISHASRWPREISWNSLNVSQQARAKRLLAIIRSAFKDHHRVNSLIGAFCEGVSLTGGSYTPGVLAQPANGYELVRQLTLEFSIGVVQKPSACVRICQPVRLFWRPKRQALVAWYLTLLGNWIMKLQNSPSCWVLCRRMLTQPD